MSITGIIVFIIFGLVVGLLARAIMPGRQNLSLVMTAILGMAGALIGGWIVSLFTGARPDRFDPLGLIGSLIGALALLAIYGVVVRRRVAH